MAAKNEIQFILRARDLTRATFRRIGRSVRSLRLGLGSLVAGVGLGKLTRDMLDFATTIDAASQRLDIGAEQLQAWRILAADLNVPFESLVTVMQRLQSNIGQALRGDTAMFERFRELGFSLAELEALGIDEIMDRIADAAQRAGSDRGFRDLIRDIGDTEALRLLPLWRRGAQNLRAARDQLIRDGTVQSAESIRRQAATEAEARRALMAAQVRLATLLLQMLPRIDRLVTALLTNIERAGAAAGGAVGRVSRADTDLARAATEANMRTTGPLGGGFAGGALLELFRGAKDSLDRTAESNERIARNTTGGPTLGD